MNAAGIMEHEPRVVPAAQKRRVFVALSMCGSQFLGKRSLMELLVSILANKIFAFSVILVLGFGCLSSPRSPARLAQTQWRNCFTKRARSRSGPLARCFH